MKLLICALIYALALNSLAAEDCWAENGAWGQICQANVPLAGQRFFYINYHIIRENKSVRVVCYALGIGPFDNSQQCKWEFWNLGDVNDNYSTLIWDNANARPAIRCWAYGARVKLTWTYTTGSSTKTCVK